MGFCDDACLLSTPVAADLYHRVAATQPIVDYHCHLSPRDIAEDRRFENLHAIWLDGDHYKWRAMRANGIGEERITGAASPREKFQAWAETVPHCLRNALYHWTHLELARYFDFHGLFSTKTADAVWEKGLETLAKPSHSCRGLLVQSQVRALCTTDDPTDSLEHHQAIAADPVRCRAFLLKSSMIEGLRRPPA
jgi:glucuronate isomerase